jgi:hypothetical protein
MNITSFGKVSFRNALIVTGLVVGLGIGTAYAASDDASAPKAHSENMGAAISDTAITAKVKTKLMGDDRLKKSDISVTTTNGVVTLEGTASDSNEIKAASEIKGSVYLKYKAHLAFQLLRPLDSKFRPLDSKFSFDIRTHSLREYLAWRA